MRFNFLCWALLLSMCLVVYPRASFAETSIAVVDVKMLLMEAKAAKSLHKKLKKQRQDFVDGLSKKEKEFRKDEKDLVERRSSLSQDEFTKEKKKFEEKLLKSRNQAQKEKAVIDRINAKAMGDLQVEIVKAVKMVANKRGYNLVLSRQNVVVADKTIDISDDALKQLDKTVSDIALDTK